MMRVLYAEDDPQIAELVRLNFARHNADCTLEVVDSGRGCLAAMESGAYSVLMVDLVMPDLTGLQVLGALSARNDRTPVIMVSGHGQHELAVRALRAGAADCIDKNSPEFRRIPEIVQRLHARRKPPAFTPPRPARDHRVLLIDPSEDECRAIIQFLATHAPRLRVVPGSTADLARLIGGESAFEAVVLGHNVERGAQLDALRQLRACEGHFPAIVIAQTGDTETTIAAFKLGAHDYLLAGPDWLTELVFSLNNALQRADTERLNARLTEELATINRSLADQVAVRTRELEHEIVVRREAEQRAEETSTRLRALSSRLLQVQEDERRSLAQELHDQIGQLLTGLRFQLEAAQVAAPSPPLTDALGVTSELLRGVRELSLQLRPRLLDDLGLKPALEWQTRLFQHQTGIEVELELTLPAQRLAAELETTVFRMVQEALTNVARHSGAQRAEVTVSADDTSLQVEIADRGRGFATAEALGRHDSLGLAGLAERVRLAGGTFDLFSQAGQGTRLHAEFSLRNATATSP
ncbi:MAG: response regulator [Opitutaceae bacterium]